TKFKYPDVVAAESIKNNIKTVNQKEGTISVEVEWKDPDMAQKINQSVIKNLREILNQKAFSIAKMNRIFYEQEMNKVSNELKESLEKLNRYQQEKKVILPENTLQNQMQMYASILSEKLKLEAELNSYSNIYTPDHPKIRELKTRLAYLSQKLAEIEGDIKTNSPLSAERTLSAIPDYMTLYIKVQQLKAKYEMLVKLLEQARIDELKENLYVEVIDEPTYPEKPSKPKKKFLVAAAFVSSLMLAVFIALVRGIIKKKNS
ncbi:MAG: GNVR domain-containing protein, partial [Candidatus Aenigmatarchaeota archaeon]